MQEFMYRSRWKSRMGLFLSDVSHFANLIPIKNKCPRRRRLSVIRGTWSSINAQCTVAFAALIAKIARPIAAALFRVSAYMVTLYKQAAPRYRGAACESVKSRGYVRNAITRRELKAHKSIGDYALRNRWDDFDRSAIGNPCKTKRRC